MPSYKEKYEKIIDSLNNMERRVLIDEIVLSQLRDRMRNLEEENAAEKLISPEMQHSLALFHMSVADLTQQTLNPLRSECSPILSWNISSEIVDILIYKNLTSVIHVLIITIC